MEKMLLAIDAINPDKNDLEFAFYLPQLTTSKITGVFPESFVAEEKKFFSNGGLWQKCIVNVS